MSDIKPLGHVEQDADPAALNSPALHRVHSDAPEEALNVPAGQFSHANAPDVLNLPAAHGVHSVGHIGLLLNVPAEHGVYFGVRIIY